VTDSLASIPLRPDVRDGFPLSPSDRGLPLANGPAIRALPQPISNVDGADAVGLAVKAHGNSAQPHDSAAAARDFEALLIGQMLRSAHESGDQDDPTSDTMWDMAAQQFSRVLANNGGLGLAQIITKSLPESTDGARHKISPK
jgi:Rod binding domain-containing protein